MFHLEINSPCEKFWLYNIQVMCQGFNLTGEQIYIESSEDIIAQVGEEVHSYIENRHKNRVFNMSIPPAHKLNILVYITPCNLPKSTVVADIAQFDMNISLKEQERSIYNASHSINQWSGASLNIEI